ncbi:MULTISPECIES: helicase-related protein [Methylobacterium]|uniref:helicase-related protein n=1 Tax=Methylobacterium TaxID=407 RepID=UPI0008E6B654|nr:MULTISPECIES: helicase-related protein [Methylobacterium]MBK3398014.1 helicase [Methylobacterium ajmalii]MBK3412462.1 helicase [Methylobacterium ajmalii]MBK3426088.1 helicase [Methylobacterium ajmalii]MBZ6415274.1 helicase [Methylobacterium sp.]SFF56117.1 ATP-dependent RNA helicase SUPV3L1/SUV3 [Methylobacterium sp. yr596]
MARRRAQPTTEILSEIVARLGQPPRSVDLEALRIQLGLPEFDGDADEARVARALRAMKANRAFAETGVEALRRTVPGLRAAISGGHAVTWSVRIAIPLLDDGRLELRVDAPPDAAVTGILRGMAHRNDPKWRLDELRAAVAQLSARTTGDLRRIVERLRDQIRLDLREVGADASAYIAQLDRSLRSRPFAVTEDLGGTLFQTLTPVRKRARTVARQDSRLRRLQDRVGFGAYIEKFAPARRLGRRIVFHMGPTNSGKTYAALKHLTEAATGTYLAPLRLLALENYEALLERGLRAGMVTGEEILGEAGPTHTARTIETADLTRPVDVAVIDEIQMLADPDRGWAWTNALFGVPARTVIVCGSDDALAYVRRAAEAAGESLEVVPFERKTPLVLLDQPVPLEKVEPGDAVVAFSRRAVHENREILVAAGHRVATIYGALSPEVRRAEAARFRTGEATVLVTTDAIGMGLNLGPLKRVVFSAVRKFDGVGERGLTNSEIRQIAGRAGRFGHQEVGYVAACEETGIAPLKVALGGAPTAPAADTRFFVRPDLIAITSVAEEMQTQSLREVLAHFARATFYAGSPFQPSALEEILEVARLVDRARLPIQEKFVFSVCPVDRRDEVAMAVLERWTQARAAGVGVPALRANLRGELDYQERAVKLASAYLWLSRRFPETFDDVEAIRAMRGRANDAIEEHLRETATRRVERRSRRTARDR